MSARLVDVRTGRRRAPATAQGAVERWPALADTVANQLLGQLAGEQQRQYLLNDLPTSAVRAYLEGRIAYRGGRYEEATALFERALDSSRVDGEESAFGLAALGLVESSNYMQVRNEAGERGLRLAWKARDRLNARDRAFLVAEAGPAYPKISTRRATLDAWSQAIEALPDFPEAFYFFGDLLAQFGPFVEWEGFDQQARINLSRALKIDSAFVPAVQRLAELSLAAGDDATAQQLASRLVGEDPTVDLAEYLRWRLALARKDQTSLAQVRSGFDRMGDASTRRIWLTTQLEGLALEDASRSVRTMELSAARSDERASVAAARYLLAMNEGRPQAALKDIYKALPSDEIYYLPVLQGQIIRDALFANGDTIAAKEAADQLAAAVQDASENRTPTNADLAAEYVQRCALEEWRLYKGNADSAETTLRRLATIIPLIDTLRLGGTSTVVVGADPVCPAIIETWTAHLKGLPGAPRALDQLDSLMVRGPMDVDAAIGNQLVARLRAERGDTASALRALRRRSNAVAGLIYLAPSLRDEGHFAAAVGDRDAAIRAYTHYLAMRRAPEAALRPEVDRVRKALQRLQILAAGGRRDSGPSRTR